MKVCPVCARAFEDSESFCLYDNAELLDGDPMVGTIVGTKYEVVSRLGRGGMGVVYKAKHVFTDRVVAMKVVNPKLSEKQRYLDMLRQEALAAARFSHPNAVTLLDFGFMESGAFYMVMEYIRGRSLRRILRKRKVLLPKRALKIARQVALAVAAAHRSGIVHLDLKPSNVMVCYRGADRNFVKVLDFGIAHFMDRPQGEDHDDEETGEKGEKSAPKVFGTAKYMSPEQVRGASVDGRSDIYSIGIMLYETLVGENPFAGRDKAGTMKRQLRKRPRRLIKAAKGVAVSKELDALVMRALEKDPMKRHQTAEVFANELRRIELGLRGSEESSESVTAGGDEGSSGVHSFFVGLKERLSGGDRKQRVGLQIERMAAVPRGEFLMGSDEGAADERPRHRRPVDTFWIDLFLVTNEDYKAFVESTGHTPPRSWKTVSFPPGLGKHPVIEITWYDAMAYARWAGKRLPTEREWEKAAAGPEGRIYPWGNKWDATRCNWMDNPATRGEPKGPSPVGVFKRDRSSYGCFDMAGNVIEWTADWYDKYPTSRFRDVDFGAKHKVLRGGSWQSNSRVLLRTANRARELPDNHGQYGFRCVLDTTMLDAYWARQRHLGRRSR